MGKLINPAANLQFFSLLHNQSLKSHFFYSFFGKSEKLLWIFVVVCFLFFLQLE